MGGLYMKRRMSLYSRLTINEVQKPASTKTQLHWKSVLVSFSVHRTVGARSCILCTSLSVFGIFLGWRRDGTLHHVTTSPSAPSWLKGCSHSPEHRDYPLPLSPTYSQGGSPRETFSTESCLLIHQRVTFAHARGWGRDAFCSKLFCVPAEERLTTLALDTAFG